MHQAVGSEGVAYLVRVLSPPAGHAPAGFLDNYFGGGYVPGVHLGLYHGFRVSPAEPKVPPAVSIAPGSFGPAGDLAQSCQRFGPCKARQIAVQNRCGA